MSGVVLLDDYGNNPESDSEGWSSTGSEYDCECGDPECEGDCEESFDEWDSEANPDISDEDDSSEDE